MTVTEPNMSVPTSESTQEDSGTHFGRWLLETAIMIALAFLLAQGIKTFVIQPFVIPTGSMEPTIMTNDRVLAEKVSFRFREARVGEIVVFDDPTGRHPQLIKRVIATGGQTVDIRDGAVVVDGEPVSEPYVHGKVSDPGTVPLPLTLADDEVWLMGDNRPNSGDSRFMGPINESLVRGRAFSIYWPIARISALR